MLLQLKEFSTIVYASIFIHLFVDFPNCCIAALQGKGPRPISRRANCTKNETEFLIDICINGDCVVREVVDRNGTVIERNSHDPWCLCWTDYTGNDCTILEFTIASGTIFGIVFGCVLLVLTIVLVIVFFRRHQQNKRLLPKTFYQAMASFRKDREPDKSNATPEEAEPMRESEIPLPTPVNGQSNKSNRHTRTSPRRSHLETNV